MDLPSSILTALAFLGLIVLALVRLRKLTDETLSDTPEGDWPALPADFPTSVHSGEIVP